MTHPIAEPNHSCCHCCKGAKEHEKDQHRFRCPVHQVYKRPKK